jgi:hypothetical protein
VVFVWDGGLINYMKIVTDYVNKKITLAVIGYKSEPEIPRCCDPFVGHVDSMIFGGGKFDFYEGTEDDDWLHFARDRYEKQGIEVKTYVHEGRQIDKRQKYLDIAGTINTDFLIVMDTDDYLMPEFTNWDRFYSNLVKISDLVPDKIFMIWEWIPNDTLWPKQGNYFASDCWRRSARIHKDPASMRYCMDCHYMWSPKTVTDEELLEFQLKYRDADNPKQYVGRIPIEGLKITMDRTLRTDDQVKKGSYWAFMNQHAEQSRQYYKIAKIQGTPTPEGFSSWAEFEQSPHTFDENGRRVDLRNKKD